MANKFVKLGNIAGMSMDDIIKRVGPPQSVSAVGGTILYQWMSNGGLFSRGYHYAILSDHTKKALHYTHQFSR